MGKVISTAIQFIDGFTKPSKAVIDSMKTLGREAINAGKQIQNAGKTITAVGSTMTAAITTPIAGIATAAVKTAANFESSMSQVAATMGKTKEEIGDLTQLAQQMGAATAFSASEAADGINILAMAGLNATQISEGLGTVLDLAAAGAMDMGSSASYVVGAVKGFRDEMSNAAKYADLMAKGATLANTDVASLGEAISYSAATAAGYSQNVDSMTLSLLRMAEQNVTGQTAATSLNRAMADLYTPTAEAKKALDKLGVSAYNADGSARDFNTVVDALAASLNGMSESEANALKNTIFTTNGLNAFNKMTASTSERVKELQEGLESAGGSAAQQAATQLDNLNGQLTLLKSAVEGIAITIGNKLMPYVKTAVSWAQKTADFINNLSDAQVNNIMKWAGIAAAVGPAVMVFGKVVTSIGTAVVNFGKITKKVGEFGGVLKMVTSPAGIVIMSLAAIAMAAVLIIKNWDKVKETMSKVGEWFKGAFDKAGVSVEGFRNTFKSIGDTIGTISDTIGGFVKKIAGIFKSEFGSGISEGAAQAVGGAQSMVALIVGALETIPKAVDGGLKAFSALLDFFGGAFRGEWENAAQGFRNSIADIFPSNIADGLIAAFDKTLPVISAAVNGIQSAFRGLIENIKEIFENIKNVFGGIGTFLKGVFAGDTEVALEGFKTAAGGAVDAVGNIFKAKLDIVKNFVTSALSSFLPQSTIEKIAGLFEVVASRWDIAIGAAKGCIDGFVKSVRPIFDDVKTILSGASQFLKGAFTGDWSGAFEGLKTIASGALSGLLNIIKAPFETMKGMVKGAISNFRSLDIVRTIFTSVGGAVKAVLTKCGVDVEKFSTNIVNIKERIGSILNNLKSIFSSVFSAILQPIRTAAVFVANIFGKEVSDTCGTAGAVLIAFKEVAGAVFGAIVDHIKSAMDIIVPVVKVAFSVIGETILAVVDSIVSIISGLMTVFDGITTFISGVFTGDWSKAWEGVKTIFKGVFDSFEALCKMPINAVIGIINGAINGINKLGLTIPEWVPVIGGQSFSLDIPTIPLLYKGTDNWMGGAAVIHDRGGEIVDLPKGSRVYPHDESIAMARREGAASKESGSVVITIQKLADKLEIRNDGDIDRIAEALVCKLKKIAFNTGM